MNKFFCYFFQIGLKIKPCNEAIINCKIEVSRNFATESVTYLFIIRCSFSKDINEIVAAYPISHYTRSFEE